MRSILSIIIISLLGFASCQDRKLEPLVSNDNKPNLLSNIVVENQNGAATIKYTLPDDRDLLYVVAEFSTGQGKKRLVKSSIFKNSLLLDGFMTTEEREITLYTVNRSENRSDAMHVTIKPLTSPLVVTFETLKAVQDFGGVNVDFFNEVENEYVLYTLIKEENDEWVVYDRLYSSAKERNYTVRGLAAEPRDFAFYFVDKWQNRSDTLFKTITPLHEEELDKKLWKHYLLDNDDYYPLYPGRPLSNLWNPENGFLMAAYPGIELPVWFTIDLGQTATLGRMKMHGISATTSNYQWFYSHGTPEIFEIWGSNNPSLDGSWDSWTLLDRFESIKPSGLPLGQKSAEDIAQALAGEDHKFSNYDHAYRYVRFKVIKTWGSLPNPMLEQLTFWGNPKN